MADAGKILTAQELAEAERATAEIGRLADMFTALAAEPLEPLRDDEPAPLFLTEEHP